MLELENLSAESFEEIALAAKKQIAYLYPDWTDTGESDPGITLIELFAWLKVLQQEYMNTVLDQSKLKLLRLLGLSPAPATPSRAAVTVDGVREGCLLPVGSRLFAGEICFETVQPQWLDANQVVRLTVRGPEGEVQRTAAPSEVRALAVFGEQPRACTSLEIGLSGPLPRRQAVTLAIRVPDSGPQRPRIEAGDRFIPLYDVAWEYYGAEDGCTAWHPAVVLRDESFGFLQSGILALSLPGDHGAEGGVYPLRAVLTGGAWDFPPRLAGVRLNAVEAEQRQTLCRRCTLDVPPEGGMFSLNDALAVRGRHIALMKRGEGFAPADSASYTFTPRPEAGRVDIRFESTGSDATYIFIFYEDAIAQHMLLGSGTGISFQRLQLPFEHIEQGSLSLLVDEGSPGAPQYHLWSRVDDFFASDKHDRHFVLEAGGFVQFGDHVRGVAPPKGERNILLGGLALTLGTGGNLQAGRIDSMDRIQSALTVAAVHQAVPATGGCDRESLQDTEARVPAQLRRRDNLVTEADYVEAVRTAPGLCIRNVKALPGYSRRGGDALSTVTLVVEGPDSLKKGLPEAYRRNLERRLEDMRLIGSQIEVVSPQYIGIELRGAITLKPYFKDGPETVQNAVREFIEGLNGSFGQTLYYGDLYGFIDMLPCVSQVQSLDIEPSGPFVEKTSAGDVRIPPGGGYYLSRTEIVFN